MLRSAAARAQTPSAEPFPPYPPHTLAFGLSATCQMDEEYGQSTALSPTAATSTNTTTTTHSPTPSWLNSHSRPHPLPSHPHPHPRPHPLTLALTPHPYPATVEGARLSGAASTALPDMGWGGGGRAGGGELGPWEQQLQLLKKANTRIEGVVASGGSAHPPSPRAGTPRAGTPRAGAGTPRSRARRPTDPLVAVLASI